MHLLRHLVLLLVLAATLPAQTVDALANRQVVVLGDSITQDGRYVTFLNYYLEKLHPQQQFQIYGLGLASETLSGLSEAGHADGKFPRPCLFERLGRLFERIKPHAARTRRSEVLSGVGGFGGLFAIPPGKYKEPILVSGTDGVGTKLKLAFAMDQHETVGIDLVAMSVNDVVVCGAEIGRAHV